MAISLMVMGVIIFLLGLLTPISDLYTLPLAIALFLFGVIRLLKSNR